MKIYSTTLFICLSFKLLAQWSSINLSEAKVQMGAVAYGTRAYFGGGNNGTGHSKLVEIYDVKTGSWTTQQLSIARSFPAVAANGGKVFFAGGINFNGLVHYKTVDIFDTLTHQWSLAELSAPRMYIQAASVGNKVLFAGGYKISSFTPPTYTFTNVVDVYDLQTNTWSTQTLSEARAGMAVAVVGNRAIFAGGQRSAGAVSDRVDLYDAATNSWSMATLSEARMLCTATTVGNKVLIAGGTNNDNLPSDRVDIFDAATGIWSSASLSEGRSFTTMSASACDQAFFAGGGGLDLSTFSFTSASNTVDIYDAATDTWTQDYLQKSCVNHSVLGVENQILVAGGFNFPNQLYKTVELYTCQELNPIKEISTGMGNVLVFPNPSADRIQLELKDWKVSGNVTARLTDLRGQTIFSGEILNNQLDISPFPRGIYILKLEKEGKMGIVKVVRE